MVGLDVPAVEDAGHWVGRDGSNLGAVGAVAVPADQVGAEVLVGGVVGVVVEVTAPEDATPLAVVGDLLGVGVFEVVTR